jgi:signal transduction histidine kinase
MLQPQTMPGAGSTLGLRAETGRAIASPNDSAVGLIHDLGNLIQIASSAVNIIARNPGVHAADLGSAIAGAKTSLERAGALVRQTIGMASERAAAAEQVRVGACLADIEKLLHITWADHIRLDVRADPDLPPVTCDSLALQSAVLNLLFNARDAMPNGGVISIRAEAIALDYGQGIELRVADSGVGMKPETIARAFDPFFTTKSDGLGGVGLPMVERFAQDTGGRVLIESEYGVGTTVRLQLPASPSFPAAGSQPGRRLPTSFTASPHAT